jgi:hypothetical protein
MEKILVKDPDAILLTDEEMAKLLATKPVDAEVGYISTDGFDEAEEDKILH